MLFVKYIADPHTHRRTQKDLSVLVITQLWHQNGKVTSEQRISANVRDKHKQLVIQLEEHRPITIWVVKMTRTSI